MGWWGRSTTIRKAVKWMDCWKQNAFCYHINMIQFHLPSLLTLRLRWFFSIPLYNTQHFYKFYRVYKTNHNFWNNWAMKTTQAILKSQDLLLPKYSKYNIIYIEIVLYWRWQFVWKKCEKIQWVSFGPIFLHWRKKQVENISPLNTTISMPPGILILVEKLENITFGGCQVNSTPT